MVDLQDALRRSENRNAPGLHGNNKELRKYAREKVTKKDIQLFNDAWKVRQLKR
jgi:hypothetical protein